MTRPTEEQVDWAIANVQTGLITVAETLAAEVVALREELDSLSSQLDTALHGYATLRDLQDAIDEVGACHLKLTATYSTEAVDALLESLRYDSVEAEAVRASREPPLESRAAKEQREGVTGPARFTASDGAVSTQPKPPRT